MFESFFLTPDSYESGRRINNLCVPRQATTSVLRDKRTANMTQFGTEDQRDGSFSARMSDDVVQLLMKSRTNSPPLNRQTV